MIELLRKRKSIRKYKEIPIEESKIAIIKEALLSVPSSRNIRPWRYILVDQREILKKLSLAKPQGALFLKGASLGVVILGDADQSDVWIEDCSIAAITLQYVAESLEIGSCWIQIRNRNFNENATSEEYIQNLLKIPKNFKVLALMALGISDEEKLPCKCRGLIEDKITLNQF